jgi:hypothetical protein
MRSDGDIQVEGPDLKLETVKESADKSQPVLRRVRLGRRTCAACGRMRSARHINTMGNIPYCDDCASECAECLGCGQKYWSGDLCNLPGYCERCTNAVDECACCGEVHERLA